MSTPPITVPSAGAGAAPAGSSAAGIGTVATVAAAPKPGAGSRFINQLTGDYEVDPTTGQYAQMPPVRQRVMLALTTVIGTSTAQPQLGLKAPRKIKSTYVAEMQIAVRSALRHLTREDAPVIRIQAIDVVKIGVGRVRVTVSYLDLTTGRPDTAAITNP